MYVRPASTRTSATNKGATTTAIAERSTHAACASHQRRGSPVTGPELTCSGSHVFGQRVGAVEVAGDGDRPEANERFLFVERLRVAFANRRWMARVCVVERVRGDRRVVLPN